MTIAPAAAASPRLFGMALAMACVASTVGCDRSDGSGDGPGATSTSGGTAAEAGTAVDTGGLDGTAGATAAEGDPGETATEVSDHPRVTIETTAGTLVVELDRINAPNTVDNYMSYVCEGFYDGLIFHRIIRGFMSQGGWMMPGYAQKQPSRPAINLEISPALRHVDGCIAMARTSDPNSAQAQFYLCDGAQSGLDDQYAVFGVTVEGLDVVHALANTPTTSKDIGFGQPVPDVPVNDVVMTRVWSDDCP